MIMINELELRLKSELLNHVKENNLKADRISVKKYKILLSMVRVSD